MVVSEHLALDHLKRGGKIQTIIGLEPEKTEIPDLRLDTVLLAEEREESRRKYNVLFRLKMEKRDWYDALILKYVGHMSDKEISEKKRHSPVSGGKMETERTGTTEKVVRKRIFRKGQVAGPFLMEHTFRIWFPRSGRK